MPTENNETEGDPDKVRNLMLRYCDERDEIQKRTFTKWMNRYLLQAHCKVNDLYEDVRDGSNLLVLLELLTQVKLKRERGKLRIHRLQNVQYALDYLKNDLKIRLVNIRCDDIVDGNPKLTLGLIWIIILSLQIEDIVVMNSEGQDVSSKAGLLVWAQQNTNGYNIRVNNFTSSWRDGKVFLAIINRNRPDLVDMDEAENRSNIDNLQLAFEIADRELSVPTLLDPEDVDLDKPDERSIITYVSALFNKFPQVPPKPVKHTYVEEYVEKRESYNLFRSSILLWINSNKELINKKYSDDQTEEEVTKMLIELKSFREIELMIKEEDLKQIINDLEKLKSLEVQMKNNGEYLNGNSLSEDDLKDVKEGFENLTNACDSTVASLRYKLKRLKQKHRRQQKIDRVNQRLKQFEGTNIQNAFMASTEREISCQLKELQMLLRDVPDLSSSASSSSNSDESQIVKDQFLKDVSDLKINFQNLIKKRIALLEDGAEFLGEKDAEVEDHLKWFQLNESRWNGSTKDLMMSQNFLNEIDDRLKALKKVFVICEDFDQTARLFDDVTTEDYKERASNRTQSLREAPTRLESRYKELRSDVDEEMRLKQQLERVAEEDRRSCCRSAINIIIKYKEENQRSHVIEMELKLLEEELTTFQKLVGQIEDDDKIFSSILDKIPDDKQLVLEIIGEKDEELLWNKSVTVQQLCAAWDVLKEITKIKLNLLEIYHSKLRQFAADIKTHLQWIEKHQNLDVIDGSGDHVTYLATSFTDVSRKQLVGSIAGLKKFKSTLEVRLKSLDGMQKTVEELADVSEQFERQVLDKDLSALDDIFVDSIEEEAKNSALGQAVYDVRLKYESLMEKVEELSSAQEDEHQKKLNEDIDTICESYHVLRSCETQLTKTVPFATSSEGLHLLLDHLKKIEVEVKVGDELFEKLKIRFNDSSIRLMDVHESSLWVDQSLNESVRDVENISVEELLVRWSSVCKEVEPRIKQVRDGLVSLEKLLSDVEYHSDWLNENEQRATIKLLADVNTRNINYKQFQMFKIEIKEMRNKCELLSSTWKSYDTDARSFDKSAYKFIVNIPDTEYDDTDLDEMIKTSNRRRHTSIDSKVIKVEKRYENLRKTAEENLEKLESLSEKAIRRESELCRRAYYLLHHRERELSYHDVIIADEEDIDETKKSLKALRDETINHEPAFISMSQHCVDQETRVAALYAPHHAQPATGGQERAVPDHLTVADMTDRWKETKEQTIERLKLVSEAEPILNNLIASLESHKRWLDEKEGSMEESEVDESDPEDARKRKDETEKLLSELSDRLSDSGGLLEAKNNFEKKAEAFHRLIARSLHAKRSRDLSTSSSSSSDDDEVSTKRLKRRKRSSKRSDLTTEVADVINRYNELKVKTCDLHKSLEEQCARQQEKRNALLKTCLLHLKNLCNIQNQLGSLCGSVGQLDGLVSQLQEVSRDIDNYQSDFDDFLIVFPNPEERLSPSWSFNLGGFHIGSNFNPGQVTKSWVAMQQQTEDRLKLASHGHEKLVELEPEVHGHCQWLDINTRKFDDLIIDETEELEERSEKLQTYKLLEKEAKKRLEKSRGMYQLTAEFDEYGRKYFLTGKTFYANDVKSYSVDKVEEDSQQRMQLVEKKVKETIKRYEDFIKMLAAHNKAEQERIEAVRIQKAYQRIELIDDAKLAEEKQLMIEDWLRGKEKEFENWNLESGLEDTLQRQIKRANNLEEELEEKKSDLISVLGIVAVVGEQAHPLGERFKRLEDDLQQRQHKLQDYLKDITEFFDNYGHFQRWLSQAEAELAQESQKPLCVEVNELQERYMNQKIFEDEVNNKREDLLELEQLAAKIKYFAPRPDSLMIKNKMYALRKQWETFIPVSNEFFNMLEELLKQITKFEEDCRNLIDWFLVIGNEVTNLVRDPDSLETDAITDYAASHDSFVEKVFSKKSEYDETQKLGKSLLEKSSLKKDKRMIKDLMEELRMAWKNVQDDLKMARDDIDDWSNFCSNLYSAIDGLKSWLATTENNLNSQGRVGGNLEVVQELLNQHEVVKTELTARSGNLEIIQSTIEEHKKEEWSTLELKKLSDHWDLVVELIQRRQLELEDAYDEASKLNELCDDFVQRISDLASIFKDFLTARPSIDQFKKVDGEADDDDETSHLAKMELINSQNREELDREKENLFALNETITELMEKCHPRAIPHLQNLINKLEKHFEETANLQESCEKHLQKLRSDFEMQLDRLKNFYNWLASIQTDLQEKEAQEITNDQLDKMYNDHEELQKRLQNSQPEFEHLVAVMGNSRRKKHQELAERDDASTSSTSSASSSVGDFETRALKLQSIWQRVWFAALERQKRLEEAKENRRKNMSPEEERQEQDFFDKWRQRYMKWVKARKYRVMDLFREVDSDQTGKLSHEQFINKFIKSSFKTSVPEMKRVCEIFDRDRDGFIDYYEFIYALYPKKDSYASGNDEEYIEDEVCRQVSSCKCCKKYYVERVASNKYRFGDAHQLRLVRVLRYVVMVRVGGGWQALHEFLLKNDPCRAKGRTNFEIHDKMVLPPGASQSMAPFVRSGMPKRRIQTNQSSPATRHTYEVIDPKCPTHGSPTTPKSKQSTPTNRNTTTSASRPGHRIPTPSRKIPRATVTGTSSPQTVKTKLQK